MINDLAKLTRRILDVVKRSARTAVTGTVGAYDAAKQAISVTPDVSEAVRIDGELTAVPTVEVPGVPILQYGGQSFGLSYGVEAGDRVLLVYRHRSHNEVDSGAAVPLEPQSGRRSSVADVVGIPGYHPPAGDLASDRYRSDGQPVMFIAGGAPLRIGVSTAAIALARADLCMARLDAIQTAFNAHVHAGVTTGPGSTAVPTPTITGSNDVSSSRVRVDA